MKMFKRLLCTVTALVTVLSFSVAAFAAPTTIEEIAEMAADAGVKDFPPDWDFMIEEIKKSQKLKDDGTLENDPSSDPEWAKQLEVYYALTNTFGSKSKYTRWASEFGKFAQWNSEDGSLSPLEEDASDSFLKKYDGVLGDYNRAVGSTAVGNTADKLFGTDNFDPDNNFLSPVMGWIYYIINTVFSVLAQLFMWGLLLQFGVDCLYIGVDFSRKIFTPFQERGEGKGGGFTLPLVSQEAANAVQGAATSGGGDHAGSKNKVVSYIIKRTPTIICGGVFLILVTGGWWSTFISKVAEIVITVLTYIMNFFG